VREARNASCDCGLRETRQRVRRCDAIVLTRELTP
jgi:hypothetical protein